jgi:hypothetical protein
VKAVDVFGGEVRKGGQAFRLSDFDPWHALSEVYVQFLILTAWQDIPYRSKTLDAAAAHLAP